MSFLRFFGDEILEMAHTLEKSGAHMRDAAKHMRHTDATRLGHDDLHAACGEFSDSWDYGFGQVSKATRGVAKFTKKASDQFLELDEKLYKELKKKSRESSHR